MPGPASGSGAVILARAGGQLIPHTDTGQLARPQVQNVFAGVAEVLQVPVLLPSTVCPLLAVAGVKAHLLKPCFLLALGGHPQPLAGPLGTVPIFLPSNSMGASGLPRPHPSILPPLLPLCLLLLCRSPSAAPQDHSIPWQLQAEHRAQGNTGACDFWAREAGLLRGCPALGINVLHQWVPDIEEQLPELRSSSSCPRSPFPPATLLRPRVAGAMAFLRRGPQGAVAHDAPEGQQPCLLRSGLLPPLQAVEETASPGLRKRVGDSRRPSAGCWRAADNSGRPLCRAGFPGLHLNLGKQRKREA